MAFKIKTRLLSKMDKTKKETNVWVDDEGN